MSKDKYIKSNYIAPLIVGVLLLLVGAYVTTQLTQPKAAIKYSLSGGLSRELLGETSVENLQLLEIRNVGKEEALKLRIRIKAILTFHKVKKFSESDNVKVFPLDDALEINYPSLPPDGIIKIVLQSRTTIENSDIEVNHSKGKAEEAFSGGTSSLTSFGFGIVIFYIFMGVFFAVGGAYSATDHLDSKAEYSPTDVLSRNKPFYVKQKRWDSIRAKALRNKIKYKSGVIDKSESYKILSLSDKIEYLTEEEWVSLQHQAIEQVSRRMIEEINTAMRPNWILDLIAIKKPLLYPEKEWAELRVKMESRYFSLLRNEGTHSGFKTIKDSKPADISEEGWCKYVEYMKGEYFKEISKNLEYSSRPMEFLQKEDLSLLSTEQIEKLKNRAYQLCLATLPHILNKAMAEYFLDEKRPEWIKDKDYKDRREAAEAFLGAAALLHSLLHIVKKRSLPEKKPDFLSEEKWKELAIIAEEFEKLKNLSERESFLKDEVSDTMKLKSKIEKQLDIIHNMLSDPRSLDRIEDYSNTFAPGNFDNLRRIAKILIGVDGTLLK